MTGFVGGFSELFEGNVKLEVLTHWKCDISNLLKLKTRRGVFICAAGRRAGAQRRSLHRVRDHSVLLGAATHQLSGGVLQSPETQPEPGKKGKRKGPNTTSSRQTDL